MRKNMWNKWCIGVFVLFFVLSCKSRQKVVVIPDVKDRTEEAVSTFELSNLSFHTFSGRAKVKVELNKTSHDLTANVRLEKDRSIWISVTALLGIEVARIFITPDSVLILDRLHGEFIKKPFTYIYNYTNEGISFATLQDVLIGNVSPTLLRTSDLQVAQSEDDTQLIGVKEGLIFHYGLNADMRPFFLRLTEVDAKQELEVKYERYVITNGYNFPQMFSLNVTGSNVSVRANMDYNRFSFNEIIELPFSVPSKYKIIE